jgi:hypothetical protein
MEKLILISEKTFGFFAILKVHKKDSIINPDSVNMDMGVQKYLSFKVCNQE